MRGKLGWIFSTSLVLGITAASVMLGVAPAQAQPGSRLRNEQTLMVNGARYQFQLHELTDAEGTVRIEGRMGPAAGGENFLTASHLDRTVDPASGGWEGPLAEAGSGWYTGREEVGGYRGWRACGYRLGDVDEAGGQRYYCMGWA